MDLAKPRKAPTHVNVRALVNRIASVDLTSALSTLLHVAFAPAAPKDASELDGFAAHTKSIDLLYNSNFHTP